MMQTRIPAFLALFPILLAALAGCSSKSDDQIREKLADATRLLRQKHVRRANAAIDEAIRLDPSLSSTYERTVRVYVSKKLWDRAEVIAKKYIARAESDTLSENVDTVGVARLYAILGSVQQNGRKLRDAETNYKKAVALAPNTSQALNALGFFYAEEGIKLDQGLKLLERAMKLSPSDPNVMDSLGWAQYKLGRYGVAAQTLRRAVELLPDQAELRYHLGAVYLKLGRKPQARVELEKALVLDPNLREPAKLLRILQM